MRAAFYKGDKPGLSALFDMGVHLWEAGEYAHAIVLFDDGRSATSTFLDGGVIIYPAGSVDYSDAKKWDFLDLSAFDQTAAIAWFEAHENDKYDSWGDAHFVIGLIHQKPNEEFCSEAVGMALGFEDAWRFDPNSLYYAIKRIVALQKTVVVVPMPSVILNP